MLEHPKPPPPPSTLLHKICHEQYMSRWLDTDVSVSISASCGCHVQHCEYEMHMC